MPDCETRLFQGLKRMLPPCGGLSFSFHNFHIVKELVKQLCCETGLF